MDTTTPGPQGEENATPSPYEAVERPSEAPFQFLGTGSAYFRIWIVNILLSLVTLGVYSAWAKVRRKQFFYGHTRVAGSAFRYLADPVKILKGRIIVFTAFLAYTAVQQVFPLAVLPLTLGLLVVLPWFVVRSLAFNARNSAWRNIRFNFTGSYRGAAAVYVFWPLLSALTLGLLGPYAYYRQKKYVVEHLAFGTTAFVFNARARDYYRIFWLFLPPLVVALLFGGLVLWLAPSTAGPAMMLLAALIYLYAIAYFSVQTTNLIFNSSILERQRFRATLRVGAYAGIVLTNTLALVATLGLFHPFARVRSHRYRIEHLTLLNADRLDEFAAGVFKETSALGEELTDFLDFDFGF